MKSSRAVGCRIPETPKQSKANIGLHKSTPPHCLIVIVICFILQERFAMGVVSQGTVPKHVAIIMDGNRRYAKLRNMPRYAGHHDGGDKLIEVRISSPESAHNLAAASEFFGYPFFYPNISS
jgi:hypothetical protein